MYTYEDYKNAPQALTIKEANQILLEIQKEITDEKAEKLYHDVELAGIEYIHVRTNWYRMTKEEKKAANDQRTLKHNAVINSLDALADYLKSTGKPASWRDQIGYEKDGKYFRKRIGDMGCTIAYLLSLKTR